MGGSPDHEADHEKGDGDAVLELIGSEGHSIRVRGLTFVILPIY